MKISQLGPILQATFKPEYTMDNESLNISGTQHNNVPRVTKNNKSKCQITVIKTVKNLTLY